MPSPNSSPAVRSSPLPAEGPVAGSSRPRRRVAVFSDPTAGAASSSDEEDGPPRASSSTGHDLQPPGQTRNWSSHGAVGQMKTSPTSRISDIVQSSLNLTHPKLPRSFTSSGDVSIVSSAHSSNQTQNQNHPESSASTPATRNSRPIDALNAASSSSNRLRQRADRAAASQGNFQATTHDALDPDSNYYQRLAHLDDSGSEGGSEEAELRLDELPVPLGSVSLDDGRGNPYETYRHALSPSANALEAESKEGHERLEWQSMLASVLAGDVLRGESTRQGLNEPTKGGKQKAIGQGFWWGIRARMRGRTEDEERRRVMDRRGRVVDNVLEELDAFSIKPRSGATSIDRRLSSEGIPSSVAEKPEEPVDPETVEHEQELSALDQVNYMLEKLSLVEALYPHRAALRQDKPLYDSEKFQARVNALMAWSTIVHQLQTQLQILQKWTGSEDLDITRPNTTKERALVAKNRYHPLDAKAKAQSQLDMVADDSTFLERVMKEDNLQRTFEKRIFVDIMSLVLNAKETVMLYLPSFTDLGLPDFQYELVRLIGFPGRLIIEALKVRLDAAAKLVDPNPMVINDMIDNFRLSISLAVLIKRQYEDVVSPDPEKRWQIPRCMAPDYDAVLLEGLRTFFKLLHWKLKSGNRAMYFKETEVLEDEWEFLYEAAEAVEGGDLVVAESFCSLTNKLMVRVSNFFETQLNVPVRAKPDSASKRRRDLPPLQPDMESRKRDKRQMTPDEMLSWYGKILEAVKMRYRKLQRFAWRLTSRHDNSAEYRFSDNDLDNFIQQMQETGHFLVYTRTFEDHGTYILADGSLWDNPAAVKQLLQRAFASTLPMGQPRQSSATSEQAIDHHPDSPGEEAVTDDLNSVDDEDLAGYLLCISPCLNFAWTGAVMLLDVDYFDLELRDNRIRLVADGPTSRLEMCKNLFAESLVDAESGETAVPIEVLIEAQAHLPRVQRELKKIARSTQRLNESIIQSAAQVRKSLEGSPGTQEMVQNWFAFASDHGRRVQTYVSASSWPRFSRLCMRLAISWVAFICDSCDPTDRRTFRWTVNALRTAYEVTGGKNILHLDPHEFALLRKSVAALVSFLILHFDILGAKSSVEAKREAERAEAMRRLQRLQEDHEDDFLPQTAAAIARGGGVTERSIRLVREERLRLISELDQQRVGVSNDQHLIGQVLDEQVSEDRALVFLAASSSNIALRWQQGAFIGGGANGNVYIGFNLDSGGVMAVKEIRVQDLSNSPTLYKQIKDESDVMSMLSHPNIVEYYGIEVHRDRVYIFEEYCEGGSLANLLEHGRVEDEEVIMVYALQMLQGLEYLHGRGIEHRDVKPDNILLGTNSTIKFVDFGAAKVIAKGNKTMARTRVANRAKTTTAGPEGPAVMNSLAGTPMYMAPEVIKNEKTGRLGSSDIWSMGCCLLEIVTGRKPWSNLDNEWAIMFHIGIATQHPPLPDQSQMSDIGIDFIEQCVTLDPTDRPSAVELIQHPWLAPMVEAMASHAHGHESSYSGSGSYNSGHSTLVDPLDSRSNSYDSKPDHEHHEQGQDGYEAESNE